MGGIWFLADDKILIFGGTDRYSQIVKNLGTFAMFILFLKVFSHVSIKNVQAFEKLAYLVNSFFHQNVNIVVYGESYGTLRPIDLGRTAGFFAFNLFLIKYFCLSNGINYL